MGLFTWADEKVKKFRWYDFSVLKVSMVFFGLWLAKVWSPILSFNSWVYFVVFVVGAVYLWYRMFS